MAGIIIVCAMLISNIFLTSFTTPNAETTSLYENGLNISYIPENKIFSITFTNPKTDTITLSTLIQVPFDTQTVTPTYLTVYEYSSSEFPINITYSPYERVASVTHFVTVTLIKETGNYTYVYTVVPDTENKLWKETGKYIKQIKSVFNKNETV